MSSCTIFIKTVVFGVIHVLTECIVIVYNLDLFVIESFISARLVPTNKNPVPQ